MKSRILEMRNFVCIITILILIGCATTKPPPQYKGTHFLMHQESNGVEVYIEPFVDKNEVKKYFGTNLIAKGIFPVYVKIVNETKDLSIFVDDTTFSLVVENNNYKPIKIDEIKDVSAGTAVATAGTCCISIPCMLLGGKMATDASVINYNFNYNKLHPTTISPGKDVSGFVYFRLPKKGRIPEFWKIQASIENFSNSNKTELIF